MIRDKIKDGTINEMIDEFKWMYSYGKKYKKAILFYTILGIFTTLMGLVGSIAGKELINIVTGIQKNRAVEMIVIIVSMSLFGLVFSQVMSRITLKINIKIQNEIQSDMFQKIIRVNWLDLSKYHGGDLLNRFGSDVSTVAESAINWVPSLIINVFNFIATLLLILYYDPTMMVLMFINAPIMFFSSKFLMGKMRAYNLKVKEMNSEMMSFETETFRNIDSIKSFALAGVFGDKLHGYQNKYKKVSLDYNMFSIKTSTVLSLIGMVVNFGFYGWAIYRLWSGAINYGEMVLFIQQSGRLSGAFSSLVGIVPATVNSTISAKRLLEIINLPKEEEDVQVEEDLKLTKGEGFAINFENVDFAYQEGKNVFESSSMSANPGEIIALVGPSGEGKTTAIRLILGLVEPQKGYASLINCNNEKFKLGPSSRPFFAYVPQGNTIFSGTIADNLRLVKEDATDEEVINALKSACAWDFVKEIDGGINGKIGPSGMGFSEGQCQRIAIARAILKDAPILLLDEATSALDIQTERKVLENIIVNHPNKTCIVTTHRPSVLSMADGVYKIKNKNLNKLNLEEIKAMSMDF